VADQKTILFNLNPTKISMATSGHSFFEKVLKAALGRQLVVNGTSFVSGGCINNTLQLHTSEGDFFLKWQKGIASDMFEKEARGLQMLDHTGCIATPQVMAWGTLDSKHYLLLEFVESARESAGYWSDFGGKLARMHKGHTSDKYGLGYDNYIGKLPQKNTQCDNWIDFFVEHRLEYQLKLAVQNRLVDSRFIQRYRKLYTKLPALLPVDQPSLLHGDLWSGNVVIGADGLACLIDPAVYYGHREIELAFTRMFGGFSEGFYSEYQNVFPLEAGFSSRIEIYNIYPLMVHANLFGASYLNGVEQVLNKYL
jgi:protein-ribulosamine 3-kinase